MSPWEKASLTPLLEGKSHVPCQPEAIYRYPCPRRLVIQEAWCVFFTLNPSVQTATIHDVRRGVWIGALGEQELSAQVRETDLSRDPLTRKGSSLHPDPRGATASSTLKLQSQPTRGPVQLLQRVNQTRTLAV